MNVNIYLAHILPICHLAVPRSVIQIIPPSKSQTKSKLLPLQFNPLLRSQTLLRPRNNIFPISHIRLSLRAIPKHDTPQITHSQSYNTLHHRLHALRTPNIRIRAVARRRKRRSPNIQPWFSCHGRGFKRFTPLLHAGVEANGADLALWIIVELHPDEIAERDDAERCGKIGEGTLRGGGEVVGFLGVGGEVRTEGEGEGVEVGGEAIFFVCWELSVGIHQGEEKVSTDVEAVYFYVSKWSETSGHITSWTKQVPQHISESARLLLTRKRDLARRSPTAQENFLAICTLACRNISRQLGTRQQSWSLRSHLRSLAAASGTEVDLGVNTTVLL